MVFIVCGKAFSRHLKRMVLGLVFFQSGVLSSIVYAAEISPPALIHVCLAAISEGKSYVEAKRQIALQQKNHGDINDEVYQARLDILTKHSERLGMDVCMTASVDQMNAYHCLVANSGNVDMCLE